MVKHDREGNPKQPQQQQLVVPAQVSSPPQQHCYLYLLLPEDLLLTILKWSRPDDQDQSIWLWLCCISATCKDFRRLVRLERKGAPSLMPTVFKLYKNNQFYLNEGLDEDERFSLPTDPVALRVKLMETIRHSDWMGSGIKCVRAVDTKALHDERNVLRQVVVRGLKELLTAPCLPRLLDVKVHGNSFAVSRDLRKFAQVHSGLMSLFLMDLGSHIPSPQALAALSASMRGLKHAGIGKCSSLGCEHLTAFMANLNPNLESLLFDFGFRNNAGFDSIEEHCPKLNALAIHSRNITSSRLASIIRSKRNLSCIELCCDSYEANFGSKLITSISETKPRLETFRANWCDWMTDNILMQLIESQIEAFNGRVLLTTLGIYDTGVTPDGLRAVLARWKEMEPDLLLTIELFGEGGYKAAGWKPEAWQPLRSEFPEVSFRFK